MRLSSLIGLIRKPSAPAPSARSRTLSSGSAVTKITGVRLPFAMSRLCSSTPLMPGILTSVIRHSVSDKHRTPKLLALGFLLIPVQASLFFSGFAEPRAVLNLRFCGAAILAWGLIVWFARDFRDWNAVRGVLIASVVGLAVNIVINVWATLQGWLNANAWGSTVVLLLLLLGGVYQLSIGARRMA